MKYIVTVNLTADQIGEAIYTDTGEFSDVQPYDDDDTGTRNSQKPDRRQTDRRQNEKTAKRLKRA